MTVSLDSDTSLLPGYYRGGLGELRTLPWPTDPVKKRLLMENSLGPRIIDWAEWRTDEPGLINDEGERWRFTDGQARFLILWYAFDEHGRFIYRRGAKRGSKGPIVHSTPVMTPDGWTTHGELKVGSKVFAEDGSVTTVTDLRPEVLEPTYRVKFRDGSHVDCTGSHRWPVEVFLGRGKRVREIKTVDEMLADGLKFKRKSCASSKCNTGDVSRFKALPSPLVDGVHVDMPVHPYVIGYWLGDGDKDSPRIVSDWDDMQHLVSEMDRLGVEHSELYHTHGNTYRVRFGKGVATAWLRESGMLGNKHIPQWLLRASSEQRWALLQGLVDSDGHVAKNGQVEISLLDNQLADDVFELAVSLGLMPTFTTGKTSFNGKAYGDRKRIRFTPMDGEVVSRLPRKFERTVRKRKHSVPFSRSRTIVDIERIESQPARCITVGHESHVYLVGERNVPTCNTGKDPFGAAICNIQFMGPSQIYFDKALGKYRGKRHEMPLVQIASNSETQSMDMLRVANSQWGREATAYYGLDKGLKSTTVKDSAARMEVLTASERSAEGDPATFIALNEALALDTPIPTPTGWTTMGELNDGDLIIGSNGSPVRVAEAFDVQHDRKCYRVTFNDGTSMVASDGHLWTAHFAMDNRPMRTLTTQQMVDDGRRVRIPRHKGVDTEDVSLPVDPYFLGYWLGDGDSQGPVITAAQGDLGPLMDELSRRGFATKECAQHGDRAPKIYVSLPGRRVGGSFGTGQRALKGDMKHWGLLGNKHVPDAYLFSGASQRLDLLRGLMDSDGCIDKNGRAVFVSNRKQLANAVALLARSFGENPKKNWAPDSRSRVGGHWRVEWTPRNVVPVLLKRKADRVKLSTSAYGAQDGIISIEPVESVPVRCIRVDAEDSLFIAGEGWKLTHNTHHMTKESGGHNTAAVARRNVGKSKRALQARMLDFTNAHVQGMDSVGERTYAAWQKQQSKHNSHLKQDILYDSIEADPRLDPYVKEERELAIRQAYSDAPWADVERLGDEILDPELTAADAIRFYLNGLAVAEDAFIEPANFTALADQSKMFEPGDRIAMFLDCSKSEDATALMGCRIDDGFCQTLGVWSRPRGPRGEGFLVDRDEVDHRVQECLETYKVVWFGVDPSPAKDDSTEASYWKPLIDQWHLQLRRKLKVWATPGAKGHAVMFDMRLSAPGGHERNRLFSTETEIIQELIDVQGLDGYFRHDGDPILVEHMNNARCRFGKFGLNMHKVTRDSTQLVDAAVAMVGACVGRRQALNSGRVRAAQKKKSSGNGPRMVIMK